MLLVVLSILLFTRPDMLGNMNQNFTKPTTSTSNISYELDKAKALETYFTFNKTDTYTLKAEYVDFVGNYEIAVYEVD